MARRHLRDGPRADPPHRAVCLLRAHQTPVHGEGVHLGFRVRSTADGYVSPSPATLIPGIEWLNDSTLVLLFHTPAAALLGLSVLSKAGFDPTEGDDPLLERAAFQFPASLLPRAEAPKPKELDYEGGETLNYEDEDEAPKVPAADADADPDAPVKRGRGGFSAGREPAGSAHGRFDLAPLAKPAALEFAEGVDPHARVTVRYATTADAKQRKEAGQSEWYKRHGRGAGKEVASGRRGYGRGDEHGGRLSDRIGTAGEGRDFARRIGRERERPYDRPAPRGRAREDDLDAELERMAASRAAGEDVYERRDERRDRRGGGDRRGGERGPKPERRGRARQDDLDKGECGVGVGLGIVLTRQNPTTCSRPDRRRRCTL